MLLLLLLLHLLHLLLVQLLLLLLLLLQERKLLGLGLRHCPCLSSSLSSRKFLLKRKEKKRKSSEGKPMKVDESQAAQSDTEHADAPCGVCANFYTNQLGFAWEYMELVSFHLCEIVCLVAN